MFGVYRFCFAKYPCNYWSRSLYRINCLSFYSSHFKSPKRPSNQQKCHYETLGLSKSASRKEIKSSYIQLAKIYHPDVNKSQSDIAKFASINEAYSILSNKFKKYQYDAQIGTIKEHNINPASTSSSSTTTTRYNKYHPKQAAAHTKKRKSIKTFFVFFLSLFGAAYGLLIWSAANLMKMELY
eukprot:UN12343